MTILVLTNADSEILAVRVAVEDLPDGFPPVRAANPTALGETLPGLDGVGCVLVRLLGGRRAWERPFDRLRVACLSKGVPLLAFGGEAVPDAELTRLSTVPAATVSAAFEYLVHGGPTNMAGLLRFVADTVLGTSFGYEPPVPVPMVGVWRAAPADGRPVVGVVFYRAQLLAGNTTFVDDLCDALEARGMAPRAVFAYSLRDGTDVLGHLEGCEAVVTTVLAAGSATDDGDGWDPSVLATLDVPIVQAIAATSPSAAWQASEIGLAPIDVAMQVAIPEFDGRIVTVPFSFKEVVDDGEPIGSPVTAYRTVADRVGRVAGVVAALVALRRTPNHAKRVAIVLSAYPTKRSRLGNAVALDTPASVMALLGALRAAGYRVARLPADGDALMDELARGLGTGSLARWDGERYAAWFAALPEPARRAVEEAWGPPPAEIPIDGIDLANVVVAIQPPRGHGADPVAVYHSPDLPPLHTYLGFYRWLADEWGAHAIVHVGKHGTLEWLPGKGVGLSGSCFPDLALGDLPLVYPFVVNDPGEGTQAKRRAHAVIVDHLLPPMTRAEVYDDLARLEALLDEHARLAALDPAKLPAVRRQVWDLLVAAEIHRDLGLRERPPDEAFDDVLLHVDSYLCELKDAQIRGGLHVLGEPPAGQAEIDLILAICRLPQGDIPPLRRLRPGASRAEVDAADAAARAQLARLQAAGWRYDGDDPTLRWVCDRLVPALRATTAEIDAVLAALDGRFVPPGPSGAPTRGMAHVLPTGRNFWSVDPKAIPTPLAWEVGQRLAAEVIDRHLRETGAPPRTVGLVVWGTACMRTGGDDVAEALALVGVRPVWAAESGRVVGIERIPDEELGRPRVDVVVRISGFFRDAFPHVVELLDDAIRMAGFDDDPRVFGAKPGGYGSGILPLLESGNWQSDDDLAAVYVAWSGWAYGRGATGVPAADAMRRRFARIDVAVKNQDNREHDIFDSDDYLQDHGGMVATVRALTGRQPLAFFGDSADPAQPRVRTLAEEAARVVRSRVLNPKWIAAMQRHGYKGAFEMAATVDYLFGYDATARVVEDWMYERVTAAYVADPEVRKFFGRANPWALRAIAERLLEAAERGLWARPSPEALEVLRAAVLEGEGWEESR